MPLHTVMFLMVCRMCCLCLFTKQEYTVKTRESVGLVWASVGVVQVLLKGCGVTIPVTIVPGALYGLAPSQRKTGATCVASTAAEVAT